MVELLCTVRGCRQVLTLAGRGARCPQGHGFDRARAGYLNLLQPQDRHSAQPGDAPEAVQARRRFLEAGHEAAITSAIVDGLAARAVATGVSWAAWSDDRPASTGECSHLRSPDSELAATFSVLDVGCGVGHHLRALAARLRPGPPLDAHGTDLSVTAVTLAARAAPDLTWVVANADRFLPYAEGSFDAVLSITSRRNGPELARVLRPDGVLLAVLPAADDLIELRAQVLGRGELRDRVDGALEALAPQFSLLARETVRSEVSLEPAALRDLLAATYRGGRRRREEAMDGAGELVVTLSRDLLWLAPRARGAGVT